MLERKSNCRIMKKMVMCDLLTIDKNGNFKSQRLVAFGRFSGIVRMIDSLHAIAICCIAMMP